MKTILISITLILTSYLLNAQSDQKIPLDGITIKVTVPVKSSEGSVIFGLFDENTFMKAAPLQGMESEIVDGKATITFTNVVPGVYAISVLHDTNGNKQMDFEPNGMPKEMYGISNNVMSYGPPLWSDARFEVGNEPLELEIIM